MHMCLAPVPAVTNHKVQLSTFARVDVIPRRDSHARLPVLVRIAVPAAAATTERRAPVDLVTLLDISYGGGGAAASKRLDLLRKAMDLVIGRLGAEDRLAIVPFHSSVTDPTGLLHMSVEGRCAASRKVQSLAVSGGTKLFPALNMAVQILEGRREEEKCREGFVILISDGDDRTIFRETIHPKYPVHAFGFRDAHDARAVHYVADHTSGVYAVLNDEHDRITDAFAACVRRVTSVVALEAQIDLTCGAYSRASLCAVENGHYKCHVEDNLRSGFIYAGSLCAGDVKNFLVYVDVDREDDFKDVTELLTVHGTYLDAPRRNDILHLDERMTVVQRHDKIPDVSRDVAAELVRVETVKMVSGVLGKCNSYGKGLAGVVTELREGWCRIKISEDARAAGSASLAGLAREMENMEASLLRCSGLSYMLSWLTRHKLQLHTAAASAWPPSSCNKAAEVAAVEHNACAIAAGDRHGKGSIAGTKRKCAEFDKIEERLAYWSKVKHDLPLMFLDAASPETSTGDHTTSVFRDASLETIDRAMFQDVYLAVLHASTVRRCTQQSCAPTSSEHSHDDHDD